MATTIDAPLQWVENVTTLRLPEQADRHCSNWWIAITKDC